MSTLPWETWNAHRGHAAIELRKETPEFIPPHLCPPISQNWIQLIMSCAKYCKRRCTKHASLIWHYRQRHWRMAAAMKTWSSLAHSVLSRCFTSFRPVMRILYTFSCNGPARCNQLDSNLANGGYRWGEINSGVSVCNDSMVARPRWPSPVSQGSIETFRWGGNCLYDFASNLFRKRWFHFSRIQCISRCSASR